MYKVKYIKKYPCIMYNPGDILYNGWGRDFKPRERKNRLTFRVKYTDDFIINYDQLDLDDIEFYLTSRVDRHNYLSMIPTLKELQKARLKELENEKLFVQLVLDNFKRENKQISENTVWESVDWWKHKNKWKRPIDKDDSKAFRMIVSNIKSIIS